MRPNTEQDFWDKVSVGLPNECWHWMGYRDRDGYGQFVIKGRRVQAHRFAYEVIYGRIPSYTLVCHKCDHPSCCNPNHLWLGTSQNNSQDSVAKGRWADRRGEHNNHASLKESDVIEIRKLYRIGVSPREIGERLGRSIGAIRYVIRGGGWRHIP